MIRENHLEFTAATVTRTVAHTTQRGDRGARVLKDHA
jgi:hypothetical protein